MARAETIETVGENEAGGNGPLPCNNTCRMEVPRPLHTWPNMLITATRTIRTGTGLSTERLHHNHHHLEPFQALNLWYQLPYSQPEGQEEPQQFSPTPPPSPPSNRRNESSQGTAAPSDLSGERSGSDRDEEEEYQHASSRRGPLPDLLPQNEHPSWASLHPRPLGGEADLRRVGRQLRMIGDEFNATVLRRAHVAPQWLDWRDVCRGLLNFITQTLSALYRLT